MNTHFWGLIAISLAFVLACSSGQPPAEISEEIEGVFVPGDQKTTSDIVMHRGGPTRTGVYDTQGVLEEPEVSWTFQADRRIATSPAVLADRVVFGSDGGNLYAVDLETGIELWHFETGRQIRSSPLVADGVVYFGNIDGTLYAINVETGDELWRFEASTSIAGSPAKADGTVYFGTIRSNFYALDAQSGLTNWQKDSEGDRGGTLNPSSAVVLGDLLYVVRIPPLTMSTSILDAIDRRNGDVVWSFEFEGWPVDSPAVSDGAIAISSMKPTAEGWVYLIDLETKQHQWVYKTEGRLTVRTSPTIAEGLVLFGDSSGRLHAMDFKTGEQKWTFDSGSDFLTSLTVADQVVYFGDVNGTIVALDLLTGLERWRFQTDLGRSAPIDCNRRSFNCGTYSIAVRNGSLYVGNSAGYFYALEHSTSTSEVK